MTSTGGSDGPHRAIGLVTVLVRQYDEALSFYRDRLGFELIEDTPLGSQKRWVVIAPPGRTGTRLLLAEAADDRQAAAVGNQGGGRVFLFLETSDFARDYADFLRRGVRFLENPRAEPYGTVAVFEDLYGNCWDLIQPAGSANALNSAESR